MPTNGYRNTNLAGCCPDVVPIEFEIEDTEGAFVGDITALGVWDQSPTPGLVLPLQAEIWVHPDDLPTGTLEVSGPVTVTENGPGELATITIPVVGANLAADDTFYIRLINGEGCGCIVGFAAVPLN